MMAKLSHRGPLHDQLMGLVVCQEINLSSRKQP
jgi:hypothetical protein